MKKMNHYQKDILFLVLIIVLQFSFTFFYPFTNPIEPTSIAVNRMFIFLEFDFVDINETTLFIPVLTFIYAALLIFLLTQKPRRFALIYGFAVALVAKAYYLSELFALSGTTYTNLEVNGVISQRITSNGEILAQDISLYILGILLVIKVGIYLHDSYMRRQIKST